MLTAEHDAASFWRLGPTDGVVGTVRNAVSSTHDLLVLGELTEHLLLATVKIRFERGVVYTYAGDTVVAVNPCRPTVSAARAVMALYHTAPRRALPPHLFSLMQQAYSALSSSAGSGQTVIVSGESGAGKTEAVKLCLAFVASIDVAPAEHSVSQRLKRATPLLEALGNATTASNANSSRFGSLFEAQFAPGGGALLGLHVSTFLLEKARVAPSAAALTSGERCFHALYALLHADEHERRDLWELVSPSWCDYAILAQHSASRPSDSAQDRERFGELRDTLEALGLGGARGPGEQMFRMLASVLHLGNVDFEATTD
eukprot:4018399-Prymnesium_polylepis.1